MEIKYLIKYLEEIFNGKFTYIPYYDSKVFSSRFSLFYNDINIGIFQYPQDIYNDICFMFGSYSNNAFYQEAIKPINIELPNNFKSAHDLAINEIKELFRTEVELALSRI